MAFPSHTTTADATGINSNGSFGNITWSHTVPSGHTIMLIIVFEGNSSGYAVNGASFNSVAATQIFQSVDGTGAFERITIYKLNNPSVGTFNVSVGYLNSNQQMWPVAISFDSASTTLGTFYSATGASANPSVTVVDSANGDCVVGAYASDVGSESATTPGGTNEIEQEDFGGGDSDFNVQTVNATGANTVCSWTASAPSGGGWLVVGVAVKASGGAAATSLPLLRPVRRFLSGIIVRFIEEK